MREGTIKSIVKRLRKDVVCIENAETEAYAQRIFFRNSTILYMEAYEMAWDEGELVSPEIRQAHDDVKAALKVRLGWPLSEIDIRLRLA